MANYTAKASRIVAYVKPPKPGQDAVMYQLTPSATALHPGISQLQPETVSCKVARIVGSRREEIKTADQMEKYGIELRFIPDMEDPGDWQEPLPGEKLRTERVSETKGCEFYLADSKTDEVLAEARLPVIQDGAQAYELRVVSPRRYYCELTGVISTGEGFQPPICEVYMHTNLGAVKKMDGKALDTIRASLKLMNIDTEDAEHEYAVQPGETPGITFPSAGLKDIGFRLVGNYGHAVGQQGVVMKEAWIPVMYRPRDIMSLRDSLAENAEHLQTVRDDLVVVTNNSKISLEGGFVNVDHANINQQSISGTNYKAYFNKTTKTIIFSTDEKSWYNFAYGGTRYGEIKSPATWGLTPYSGRIYKIGKLIGDYYYEDGNMITDFPSRL